MDLRRETFENIFSPSGAGKDAYNSMRFCEVYSFNRYIWIKRQLLLVHLHFPFPEISFKISSPDYCHSFPSTFIVLGIFAAFLCSTELLIQRIQLVSGRFKPFKHDKIRESSPNPVVHIARSVTKMKYFNYIDDRFYFTSRFLRVLWMTLHAMTFNDAQINF